MPYPESFEGGSQPWYAAAQELLLLPPERLRFMVPALRETLANKDEGWSESEFDLNPNIFLDEDSPVSKTIHTLDIACIRTLVELLLHITFARLPDGKASRRPPLAELTEEQRAILLILCTRQEPWEMANTLKAYGLPYSWKMMSHYLEQPGLKSPLIPFMPTEKPESISDKLYNGSPHMQEMASVATDQYKIYSALQKYLSLPLQQSLSYLGKWLDEVYHWVTRNGLRPVRDGTSIGRPFTQAMLADIDDELLNMLALELGTFLYELHHIPVHELADLELPLKHSREAYESLYKRSREVLFPHIGIEERENLAANFETFLDTHDYFDIQPVVVHGNFGPRSILYDETRHAIGGIALWDMLNFSQSVSLGDPASDFATMLGPEGYGEDFLKRCEPAYPDLPGLSERISFHELFHTVQNTLSQLERPPLQYKFEVRSSFQSEKE
ncbi:phosphotransferase family protein [Ktedonospora formicarum]|uniref:Uncharacterized protein n=1 Tax=Ktedonospora formicarum TaxID=2778364 RepID=A0A8J3I981_9CHLR|nr:aminoglycoside phosphotransferase family protein [Ktedonospora formicarum]GHO49538.1 hypothetical protein KSX_77010 [Ktedonospora formicarum]